MNWQSILLLIAVLGLALWAFHHYIRKNRRGGGCCGSCGCGSCEGCSLKV